MAHWLDNDDSVWSTPVDATPALEHAVADALTVFVKGAFMDPRYRAGVWDGTARFYDRVRHRAPTGLLAYLESKGVSIPRVPAAVPFEVYFNANYKPERFETTMPYVTRVMDQIQNRAMRGIVMHGTGAGKTGLIASIARAFPGLNVLVATPTVDLVKQTAGELRELCAPERIGAIGGKESTLDKRITVAWDGAMKRLGRTPQFQVLLNRTQILIFDEAQTITEKSSQWIMRCPAPFRYALTGSLNELAIERILLSAQHFGPVLDVATDADTAAAGRTVPPHFEFYQYPVNGVITETSIYREEYDKFIADNPAYTRHFIDILVREHLKAGEVALILVKRVRHARTVIDLLAQYEIYAEEYTGAVHAASREDLKADYKAGAIPVLVATDQTFGVGQDIPRINVLLNLGGGLSADKEKQKIGRGLRSFPGKEFVTVIQPYLTGHKWLTRHSAQRLALAKRYKTGQVTTHRFVPRAGLNLI